MNFDQQLLLLINHEWARPSLDPLMAAMSNFDLWLPFIIATALLTLWRGGFKARTFVICALLTIAVSDGLVSHSLKKAVNRPRPSQIKEGVRVVTLRKARPQFFALAQQPVIKTSKPRTKPSLGWSFPSSHIMNMFAAATACAFFYRRFGWLAFVPATLVAYSRIYVGSHWPTDAIISTFLGICVALLVLPAADLLWRWLGARLMPVFHAAHPRLYVTGSIKPSAIGPRPI